MKNMSKRNLVIVPALCVLFVVGCRTTKSPTPEIVPKRSITSIRVGNFQCENAITAQAIRNVFIETLALRSEAKLIREGESDVVIEGTVTIARGGGSSGKTKDVAGVDYVSGVTSLVLRNGEILTSASWGQVMTNGRELLPPESVARNTAERLFGKLCREGLKRRENR